MMPPYEISAGDGDPPKEGDSVYAGSPRDPAVPVATEDNVVEALRTVYGVGARKADDLGAAVLDEIRAHGA